MKPNADWVVRHSFDFELVGPWKQSAENGIIRYKCTDSLHCFLQFTYPKKIDLVINQLVMFEIGDEVIVSGGYVHFPTDKSDAVPAYLGIPTTP